MPSERSQQATRKRAASSGGGSAGDQAGSRRGGRRRAVADGARKRRIQPIDAAAKKAKQPAEKVEVEEIERSVGAEIFAVLLFAFGAFLLFALCSFLSALPTGMASSSPSALGSGEAEKQVKDVLSTAAKVAPNVMGPLGDRISRGLFALLGYCSFVTVLWAFLLAKSVWQGWWPGTTRKVLSLLGTVLSSFVLAAAFSVMASVLVGPSGGGRVGEYVSRLLIAFVNPAGTLLLGMVVVLLTFTSSTGVSISRVFGLSQTSLRSLFGFAYAGGAHSKRFVSSVSSQGISLLKSGIGRRGANASQDDDGVEEEEDEFEEEEPDFVLGDGDEEAPGSAVRRMNEYPIHGDDQEGEEEEALVFPEEEEAFEAEAPEIIISRQNYEGSIKGRSQEKSSKEKKLPERPSKRKKNDNYQLPSPILLVKGEQVERKGPTDKELLANSKRLEQTLMHFRVGGRVVEVHPGPVVTLYQFEPAAGVKVQRIITLADDLALALKVSSIRVYAPVPGRGTVGIEVPREDREIVRLRDLIDVPDFVSPQHHLPLALGKDTFGEPYIADLSRMPHLLIAGATGTGKSVCINSLLLSLLYRHSPDDLRLIMIDPKMLELSVYEDIPHLKAPVVTLPKKARGVLWWAVEEMDRRYALMKELGVRNLASYNLEVQKSAQDALEGRDRSASRAKMERQKHGGVIELEEKNVVATSTVLPALDRELHGGAGSDEARLAKDGESSNRFMPQETLPRIVIVVDELADLMLTVGREIEELLTRLAQKARAAGIHLILATQRPSVDVITGLIKANFPSRISFKVASRIDARTVLDNSGAERLLGQGDMLFLSPGAESPKRLHSPFVSDQEVHDVVEWIRSQGEPDYDPRIEAMIERIEAMDSNSSGGGAMTEEEYDPLYDQAYNLVVEKGMASTSMVQRVFRIGYNRAARILETMEREGVVGPADGAKPRQVLIPNRNLE